MHARISVTRAQKRWSVRARIALCAIGVVGVIAPIATAASMAGAASDTEPITRTVYGQTSPENAPGQDLYLQRVVIQPGAKLPEHFHQGTQIATVQSGVLTYNVESGEAIVTRAGGKPATVKAPSVVTLRKRDSLVETQSLVHFGSNKGKKPVVIDLAALLAHGAPLSTPVGSGNTDAKAFHAETTLSSQSRTLHQVGANGQKTYGWNQLTGNATVDGQPASVELLGAVDYDNGSGPFSGFVTFTWADGSSLAASMQGLTTVDTGTSTTNFAATLGVVGGTGAYANTTGTGTFIGSRTAALGGDVAATFDLGLR
jgi:hypothetical protein